MHLVATIISIATVSCSNNLDEIVYSNIMESTYNYQEKDFDANIAGAYSVLRSATQMSFWQLQELTGCCVVTPANASGWDDGGIYKVKHLHTWTSELGEISNIWNDYFRGIVLCNSAIEKIEKNMIPVSSDIRRNQGLAELRALRAYYYWLILDNFGDAPLVTAVTQDFPEKTPRTKIFDFIIKDLEDAIPNLREEQDNSTYGAINKWAGNCLLANLYLNAGVYTGTPRWEDCIKACDAVIQSGKCGLAPNYRDNFLSAGVENSKEILFTIPYDYYKGVTGNWLYMNAWHKELKKKYLTALEPNAAGGPKAIPQFIDIYEDCDGRLDDTWLHGEQYDVNGNVLRGCYDKIGEPLNFTKELPNGLYTNEMEGYRVNKYEVSKDEQWSSNTDIPIFRYSEILMMKAECLLRLGRGGAGDLVTQVRNRNFKNNPSKATVTDDDLKGDSKYQWGYVEDYQIIDPGDRTPVELGGLFDEYLREFCYESHCRRDMIRFGVYTSKSWLSHKPNGDYRNVFPIPENVLTSNPKIEQNQSYK